MGWATLSAAANRVASDRLGSVAVTAGAASGRGFLQQNSELILNGNAVIVDYLLTVETALFGFLAYNDPIYIEEDLFTVEHEPLRFADGTWCHVPLTRNESESAPDFVLDGDTGFDSSGNAVPADEFVVIYDGDF